MCGGRGQTVEGSAQTHNAGRAGPSAGRGAALGPMARGRDGTDYEIDLNAKHAQALRDALAPYVGAARRAGSDAGRPARSVRRAPTGGLNTTEVREWAKAQGIEVKERGRVPADLAAKFKEATAR